MTTSFALTQEGNFALHQDDAEHFITVAEASDRAGISVFTIFELIDSGEVSWRRGPSGRALVDREDIDLRLATIEHPAI